MLLLQYEKDKNYSWKQLTNLLTPPPKKKTKPKGGKTHVVLADLADELLGFVHGSGRRGEHGESLLIHLIYRHAL